MKGGFSIIKKLNTFADSIARDKHFPLKIFLIALIARVIFTLVHPSIYLITDMLGYNEAAISLIQDGEFRVKGVIAANRPPIYPYFLMVMYTVFGQSFILVRLVQALIGALTAVLLFKIGAKMFDRRVGLLAGLIYALYPATWAFCDQLLTEALFTLLMMVSIWCMIQIPSMKSPWFIFGAGFFAGIAALTRTAYAPFPLFIFLGIIILRFNSAKVISRFALSIVIFIMVLFPWMLRTYYTHGVFTLNPKSGVDFCMYNHSSLPYIINNYSDDEFFHQAEMWKLDEVAKGREGMKIAKEWIKNNPHLFLIKGVRQIMNIWGFDRDYLWYYIAGYYGKDPIWLTAIIGLLMGIPFILIAPLSTAGFFISKPFSENRLVPSLLLICLHVLTFVVYGFSRHRFPFAGFLIVWAVYAALNWNLVTDTLRRRQKSWRKTAIIFSWAFILFAWTVEILVDVGSLVGMRFVGYD